MGTTITSGFEVGDDQKVISILKKWDGGPLSDALFASMSRLTPQVSTIVAVFRDNNGTLETLLLPRPGDDPVWPNMLNLPGKMFRAVDFRREDNNPINGPIERIINTELKTELDKKQINYAGLAFQNTKRGAIIVLVHTVFVNMDFKGNEDWVWRSVESLRDSKDMIPTEMDAIEVALKNLK